MKLLIRWLLNALALLFVAYLLPGFTISGIYAALIAAFVLGFMNAIIRPILLFLTLPITILTLGLFSFVINALMLWAVSTIVKGVEIDSFVTAIMAAVVLWLVGFVTNMLLEHGEEE